MLSSTIKALLLATLAVASPIVSRTPTAESQLLIIAPSSSSCDGAQFPSECATAHQAAPFLIQAMQTYEVYTYPEFAALLSLIAFESGEFKFNINHFPGRAGQGTRNMMMINFVLDYALSIPELKPKVLAITNGSTNLSDDLANQVRALVLPDQYSWASVAWFLSTQCASARPAIQAGGLNGYKAYLACVGVDATDDRIAYWNSANTAFGL